MAGNKEPASSASTWASSVDTSIDACATATAAGHPRITTDVRSLHPGDYPGVTGLIASPPCPTLSRAGKGSAYRTGDLQRALDSITSFGAGCGCDWADLPHRSTDIRTALMVEPARWALGLPDLQWMALEQVPDAEFTFEDIAAELLAAGWEGVDVMVLDAADYGCSARRRRVFLCANRTRPVDVLLGYPDHPVVPAVTFAQALGWESGHQVRTRAQRRPTGGNLFSADTVGWCLTEKMRSWERDADGRRFTPAEAGVVQGFPADYPWSGSRTSQFKQAGDVVAPPVAAAVIGAAIGIDATQVADRIRTHVAAVRQSGLSADHEIVA